MPPLRGRERGSGVLCQSVLGLLLFDCRVLIGILSARQPKPMHYDEREAAIYDRVYAAKREDIEFWQTLTREYAEETGEALELACGTLRVALPVAQAGVRVTGIDESPHMLALAREKLAGAPPEVRAR